MTTHLQLNIDLLNDYKTNLGTVFIKEMLDLYQTQASSFINQLTSLSESQQQTQWYDCCHKMKSAASSIGFIIVRNKLAEMEKSTASQPEKLAMLSEFSQANQQAENSLVNWLSLE